MTDPKNGLEPRAALCRQVYGCHLRIRPERPERSEEGWERHRAALQWWLERNIDRDAPGSVVGKVRVTRHNIGYFNGVRLEDGPDALRIVANVYVSPDPRYATDTLRTLVDTEAGEIVRVSVPAT